MSVELFPFPAVLVMVKIWEPSIMADMNVAKTRPNGGEDDSWPGIDRADLRAADQKKTKRYIVPSKKQHIRPSETMRLSLVMLV